MGDRVRANNCFKILLEIVDNATTASAFPICCERITDDWLYHWRGAISVVDGSQANGADQAVSGFTVAYLAQQGVRYANRGGMGSNPFRDLVLAEGVLQQDAKSIQQLDTDYRHLWEKTRSTISFGDTPEHWEDLLVTLSGADRDESRSGILCSFSGYGSLNFWLK